MLSLSYSKPVMPFVRSEQPCAVPLRCSKVAHRVH
jgi:hypothetical protein